MSEFEQRQRAHSSLLTPAAPDRAIARPVHAKGTTPAHHPLGNQSAQRFAQSCPIRLPSPGACPFGGACHTCPAPVQTKLTVNEPGDKYEQEADRVADQVMRMPAPYTRIQRACSTCQEEERLQPKSLAGQITPLIQRQEEEPEDEEPLQAKVMEGNRGQETRGQGDWVQRQEEEPEEEEPLQAKVMEGNKGQETRGQGDWVQRQEEEPEEEEPLQAKRINGRTPQPDGDLQAQVRSLRGGGQPLPQSAREFFEPRFGTDLAQVRVHTDARAGETAKALKARAFTVGRDVVFGSGQYAPGTSAGQQLIAHELTHVVQQQGGKPSGSIQRAPLAQDDVMAHQGPSPAQVRPPTLAQAGPSKSSGQMPTPAKVGQEPRMQRQEMEEENGKEPEELARVQLRTDANAGEHIQRTSRANSWCEGQNQIHALQTNGQPLPKSARSFFEPRFGHDFGRVRVHTGGEAAEAARAMSARAFTMGHDIVFGGGQYAPGTSAGKRLLAHELTHVVQQGAGRKTDVVIQRALSTKQVQDAIDYNEKMIGGNADYFQHFVMLLNMNLGITLSSKTIDAEFVQAIARYQDIRKKKAGTVDGKLTPVTRKLLSEDLQILLVSSSKASAKAQQAAKNVLDMYMTENILFDSWGNDCRDNNKSGQVDQNDPKEKDAKDGTHKSQTYTGFKTKAGTYRGVTTVDFETNEPVNYRVCAHVVTRAYKDAGIMPGVKGSVARTKAWFASNKRSKCWKFGAKNFPAEYRAGDFICSIGNKGHGHAGMVIGDEASKKGTVRPVVVHLPGPSLQIRRGRYNPIRLTDLRLERWPSPRPMHHLCRYNGK